MAKKSKKQLVLEKLYLQCKKKNNYVFSNNEVKEIARELSFGNPFDVPKIDNPNSVGRYESACLRLNYYLF